MTDLPTKEKAAPINAGDADVRQYLSEIRRYPRLEPQQELELAKRCAQGDEDAIRQLVNSNLRLVVSVAREYAGRGVPLQDLIQEGSIGLLAAARKYDYTLEFRFSTYATKWIRQGVTRCLKNHANLIRVPTHTAERIRKIVQTRTALWQENGEEPTDELLAATCEISVEKLQQLRALYPEIRSLDASVGEDDVPMGAVVEDLQTPQPFETLVREELTRTINGLLQMLTPRQQEVLVLRFGMHDGICYSFEQIGKSLDISKERARQITQEAIEKLQKLGASMGLEDFLE
ncbi:MAG: RNA polymerase sigma factor RpoD/SigA [Ruminococcaceae bacterium]|nr:RNA polymerase sigma factor RpoD/SigA [Oscillospiraceae bacterium]